MAGDLVAATPSISVATSRQILDYVLCKECEQRFNTNGEGWVMRHVFLSNGRFPLLEKLEQCPPEQYCESIKLYSAANRGGGIDTTSLGYFALSVLWRASVHDWTFLGNKTSSVTLGRYEEILRKYLLGVTPFPTKAVVMITACTDRLSQEVFYEPTTVVMRRHQPYHTYGFLARGIHFQIFLGATIPWPVRQLCCVSSPGKWIIARDREKEIASAFKPLHAVSRIARNLA
jgi:hypothetical protein